MTHRRRPATRPGSVDDTTQVSRVRIGTLDRWLNYSWEHGVQIDQLEDLQALRVETSNSTYDLAIISSATAQILVRGGRYFPEWTPVQFVGCSLGGGLLKRYGVHVGFSMEFYSEGRLIITSPVRAVNRAPEARSDLARPAAAAPPTPPPVAP